MISIADNPIQNDIHQTNNYGKEFERMCTIVVKNCLRNIMT